MSESISSNCNRFDGHELSAAEPHHRDSALGTPLVQPQGVEYGERYHHSEYEPSEDMRVAVHVPLAMQPSLPHAPAVDVSPFVTPEPTPSLSTPIHRPVKNEEPGDDDESWMFGSSTDDVCDDTKDLKSTKKDVHENIYDEESLNLEPNYDPMIEVYVGPKGEKFEINEHLLCHMSGYFLDHFRNKRPVPVKEPELFKANSEFFGIFHHYCYSNQIVLPRAPTKAKGPVQYLLGAYYLADKLAAQRFKNAIVDQLSRELIKRDIPSEKFANWAKQLFGKVHATPLRLLFTNTFYLIHKNHYRECESGASHADMKHELLRMSLGSAKDRPKQKELKIDSPDYCKTYHEHDHYNPSWTCQAERPVKNPLFKKTPAKSARGNGLLNSYALKARKEILDDERHEAGLRKPTKKRKTKSGAIDATFVEEDDDDDDDNIPFQLGTK